MNEVEPVFILLNGNVIQSTSYEQYIALTEEADKLKFAYYINYRNLHSLN